MASSAVRCAVIGLGIGSAHANGYLESPEAKLVAVADIDPARLAKWKEKVGDEGLFSDYKAMLKKVRPDLVSVALPNFLHARATIDALAAGAHVLCEKPMAMNVPEALKMQRAATRHKRKLGINLSFRFTPQARALKDLADSGFLGSAYHAHTRWMRREGFPRLGSWFVQKKYSGGGPLIDLGVHRIDLAMWLMGGPRPISVSSSIHHHLGKARAKSHDRAFDVEDLAAGFVRFEGGESLLLEISWAGHQQYGEQMSTMVMGSKGTLVHRNDAGSYHFVGEYFTESDGHKLSGVVTPKAGLRSSYGEMVRAIANDTEPLATAEDGIRVQRVLDALYQSAESGREARID
jgi:predicted dehydrogenase